MLKLKKSICTLLCFVMLFSMFASGNTANKASAVSFELFSGEYSPTLYLDTDKYVETKVMLRNPYYQQNYDKLLKQCVDIYEASKPYYSDYFERYLSIFFEQRLVGRYLTVIFKAPEDIGEKTVSQYNMEICKKYFTDDEILYVGDTVYAVVVEVTDRNISEFANLSELEFIGDAFFVNNYNEVACVLGIRLLGDVYNPRLELYNELTADGELSEEDKQQLANVDGSQKVTAADARYLLRYCAKLETREMTKEFGYCADVNFDNVINAADARLVLRIAAKLDPQYQIVFPYEAFWNDNNFKYPDTPQDLPGSDDPVDDDPIVDNPVDDDPVKEDPQPTEPKDPTEQALEKYTLVMNDLKNNVASFDTTEYQELGGEYDIGDTSDMVMSVLSKFMFTQDNADVNTYDDPAYIPVYNCEKGCLLTDASAVESATMNESFDKTTVVITLKDEMNSVPYTEGDESCPSAVGSMFTPININEIEYILGSFVTMKKFDTTYKKCTATLVFDTVTGRVESLTQTMNIYSEMDLDVFGSPVGGYFTIINTLKIDNIDYRS